MDFSCFFMVLKKSWKVLNFDPVIWVGTLITETWRREEDLPFVTWWYAPEQWPPPLHLTSKVMVIVWRLRGNIIWTVLYWQRATSSMGTVNRNSSHIPIGPWVCLCVFSVAWLIFMFMCVLFLPWSVESCPFMFRRWRNKLKWASFEFLLPPHYCGLGAGFIPFRAIVNNKQCEMRVLLMSLVIHYWIGDVQDCQGVSASVMTCIVSSGALNSTHSLTHLNNVGMLRCCKSMIKSLH